MRTPYKNMSLKNTCLRCQLMDIKMYVNSLKLVPLRREVQVELDHLHSAWRL